MKHDDYKDDLIFDDLEDEVSVLSKIMENFHIIAAISIVLVWTTCFAGMILNYFGEITINYWWLLSPMIGITFTLGFLWTVILILVQIFK